MNVTDKIISLEGIDLLNFSGINDQNLNLIKDYFDSTIVLRGDTIFLKGENDELKIIEKVFNELIFLQKRQGEISQKDVKLVLSLIYSKDDQIKSLKQKFGVSPNDLNDVILSRKNDFIKPRTPNQFEYFKKVKDNDIVFAIGPAGTGKTYLAVAFAVAAHLDPEILIVDEVLAVGDAEFQKKCLGKIQDVSSKDGRTVLFVSHNMAVLSNLCSSVIVLKNGMIDYTKGPTKEGIQYYLSDRKEKTKISLRDRKDRKGDGKIRLTPVSYTHLTLPTIYSV